MTWRRRASPTASTRRSYRVIIWSWRASALPSRLPLSFPLLFPLLVCSLLGLFLCPSLSAIVLLFFIHLFLVIDPSPVRLSLIGRIVCVHPGESHRRGRGEESTAHPVTVVSSPNPKMIKTVRGTIGGAPCIRPYALPSRRYLAPSLVKLSKNRVG
jgi:hypothetical protein